MVEILCLSAEITVGLLIAAILWDRSAPKSNSQNQPAEATHSANSPSFREASLLFEQCLHLQNRMENFAQNSAWFPQHQSIMFASSEALLGSSPSEHVDRLTGLRTPTFLHEVIEKGWTTGSPMSGCIAWIDVDGLKGINDEKGMDTGDLLLQQIGNALHNELVTTALSVRIEGGKFAILFPSLPLEGTQARLEQIRSRLSSQEYSVKGQQIAVTLSASLIELGSIESCEEIDRLLQEGLFQAKAAGRNRSFYRHQEAWKPIDPVRYDSNEHPVSPIEATVPDKPSELPLLSPSVSPADSPIESASSDDIEALLAAARTNFKPAIKPKRQDEIGELISTMDDTSSEERKDTLVDSEKKASSDDIAALFANNQTAPKGESPKGLEKKVETEPVVDLSSGASSDDIESLLASMRGGASSTPASKAKSAEPTIATAKIEPAKSAAEESASVASAGDIEALLASMRGNSPAKPTPKDEEASKILTEVLATSKEVREVAIENASPKGASEEIDPTAAASSDDIEALFASIKAK